MRVNLGVMATKVWLHTHQNSLIAVKCHTQDTMLNTVAIKMKSLKKSFFSVFFWLCIKVIESCMQKQGPLPSWVSLEYANCILSRGVRSFQKRGVLGMTLNCIWWWGSNSGVWSTPSLSLLPHPLWPGVVVPVRVQSMDQIDILKIICIW